MIVSRFRFVWLIMFCILAGRLAISAGHFGSDGRPPSNPSQTATLSADADPAALQRSALDAFTRFARLQARFDLGYLAYYDEQAAVHFRRLRPDGGVDVQDYGRAGWADLQRHLFSDGAERISQDAAPAYNQLHAHVEGGSVIIEGKRRIESESHTGPYKVAMVPTADGDWRIVEEWIESKQ